MSLRASAVFKIGVSHDIARDYVFSEHEFPKSWTKKRQEGEEGENIEAQSEVI